MAFVPDDLPALFDFFAGQWHFKRTIYGQDALLQAEAQGQCEFLPAGEGRLAYREQGILHMLPQAVPPRPIAFTRLFDYRFDETGVAVFFNDGHRVGEPYQRYVLRGHVLAPAADHLCGPDCYNASYDLQSPDDFLMETIIRGPKKQTRVLTAFARTAKV